MSENGVGAVVNLRPVSGELRVLGALLSALGDVSAKHAIHTAELRHLCDNLDRLRDYIVLEIRNAEC